MRKTIAAAVVFLSVTLAAASPFYTLPEIVGAMSGVFFSSEKTTRASFAPQAIFFSQNFSSSSVVADYVNVAAPNSGQFNAISTSGAGTTVSISGNALLYSRTGNAGSFSRTTDLTTPAPTALKYSFSFRSFANTGTQTTAAVFQVGSGYGTTNSAESNANTYARFGINIASASGYSFRELGASANSPEQTGLSNIVWALNNSGSTITYQAPNGSSETVANDTADLWVGNVKLFDNYAVTTATQTITDLKFAFTGGTGSMEMDNFVVEDLSPFIPPTPTPTPNQPPSRPAIVGNVPVGTASFQTDLDTGYSDPEGNAIASVTIDSVTSGATANVTAGNVLTLVPTNPNLPATYVVTFTVFDDGVPAASTQSTLTVNFHDPPNVSTLAASNVLENSATLNGNTSNNVMSSIITARFRYSTTNPGTCNDTFGTRAPTSGGAIIAVGGAFFQNIAGLSPGTTYFYCAIATNTGGTTFGSIQQFTTTSADVTPPQILYTPLINIPAPVDTTFPVNVSDDLSAVSSVSVTWESNGSPTSTTEPCVFDSGTQWTCPIGSSVVSQPGTVSYFVSASDAASNSASNPASGRRNLFTIGDGGSIDTTTISDFDTVQISSGWSFAGNASVATAITIDGNLIMGGNTLTIGCDAGIFGAGPGAYVVGRIQKEFCAPQVFTFPVGTLPEEPTLSVKGTEGLPPPPYSPFTANVTAVTAPSSLTVIAVDGVLNGVYAPQAVSRWWDVTESGDLTADISFTWLDVDVAGSEAAFQVIRNEGFAAVYPGGTVNAGTNTATAPGVSQFSGWSAGFLIPTAGTVELKGRVVNANGRGLSGVDLAVTDVNGNIVGSTRSSSFGYYTIGRLAAGESYIVSVRSKRYAFEPSSRVVMMGNNVDGFDFVASP